jgi:transcription termination factor Rho
MNDPQENPASLEEKPAKPAPRRRSPRSSRPALRKKAPADGVATVTVQPGTPLTDETPEEATLTQVRAEAPAQAAPQAASDSPETAPPAPLEESTQKLAGEGASPSLSETASAEPQAARAREEYSPGQGRPQYQPRQQEEQREYPRPEPVFGEGVIEVSGKGFGFLREPKRNFVQAPQDIFVPPEVVRRFNLRDGMWIKGEVRRGNRGSQLFRLTEINGDDPEKYRDMPSFEELTTINPNSRIRLETVPDRYTTRVMDLMTPIGKGQRGLIVAPPRTGKTTLLQHIADAVVKNHPEMKLIILLVDERPEEVTEIRRTVPQAEIMASSNDSDLKSHTRIAQLAIERAKRLVEANKDVFILLDSLTRVGRAFNNATGGGGRTLSGGMDSRAMEIPRKLFAAARNTEEAGSLTIMATALIETGSRMDDLIFQEFKGTGNMELVLDRKISDQRIYPAVDIFLSGTRREELLVPEHELHKINVIRRGLAGHKPIEAIERLLTFLRKFPTNAQMLREIPG